MKLAGDHLPNPKMNNSDVIQIIADILTYLTTDNES